MEGNPTSALDAILDSDKNVDGVSVKKLTMARMALLELIGSPFVKLDEKFSVSNMVPSAFIVCADTKALKGFSSRNIDALIDRAYEWADTIDVQTIPRIIECVLKDLADIYRISPSNGAPEDENKSGNTSSQTSTGV